MSRALDSDTYNQRYFDDQVERENPEFWRRFGTRPPLEGRAVLDVGCGHGALTYDMAGQGAHVVGIDTDKSHIRWAREHVEARPVRGTMRFVSEPLETANHSAEFDLVISKNTMEHVDDVPTMFAAIHRALKTGGEFWAGFSPLYYSPRGDHGRTGLRLLWAHTLPQPFVHRVASRYNHRPVASLGDLGLNGLTAAEFRSHALASGFQFESILYNQGDKPHLRALAYARRLAPLERYTTVSIYATLRKP